MSSKGYHLTFDTGPSTPFGEVVDSITSSYLKVHSLWEGYNNWTPGQLFVLGFV